MDSRTFRAKVRAAMQYDHATLLYADGMAAGVSLDTGFFSKAARIISPSKDLGLDLREMEKEAKKRYQMSDTPQTQG